MKQPGRAFALWGAWLQLGTVFGLLGIVILVYIIPRKAEFENPPARDTAPTYQ